MNIQALVPPALAALHNFLQEYNPEEIHGYDDLTFELQMGQQRELVGELGTGQVMQDETVQANVRQDRIAHEMWEQYQDYLREAHSE